MRLIRTSMLVIVATCALGALAASSASAALPEIGRCVKVEGVKEGHTTKFDGKYSDHKCTKASASSKGKFEWEPGAGTEKTFESPGTLEPVTLQTAAGTAVECKNSKQDGEYTGATTEKDEISLYECTLSTTHETCQSLRLEETPPTAEAGTILSLPIEGTLGMIKQGGKRPQIGWSYKAKTGTDHVPVRMWQHAVGHDRHHDRRLVHLADRQTGEQDGRRIQAALDRIERETDSGNVRRRKQRHAHRHDHRTRGAERDDRKRSATRRRKKNSRSPKIWSSKQRPSTRSKAGTPGRAARSAPRTGPAYPL